MALLEVRNLTVRFGTHKGMAYAVRGMNLSLGEGKTLAVVGESGSGKSVTAMSILRLLEKNGVIEEGEILFDDGDKTLDLTTLSEAELRTVRGNKISVIFQEPMTALNPVLSVKRQLCEPFRIHRQMTAKQAVNAAMVMLDEVQIPNKERVMKGYPHQLSGGMRQRVMIAMALACKPKILIADEPTTALDVTVQAQILRLMKNLQKDNGTAVLLITHDLGVVRETADEVAVVYLGRVVENAPAARIFSGKYSHPYTEGLLASLPSQRKKGERLQQIEGSVPSPYEKISGCPFSPRCPYATQKCTEDEPKLLPVGKSGQSIRCHYPNKEQRKSDEHAQLIIRRST